MAKAVGGRGLKADYETVIMRVPLNLKPIVVAVIDKFHSADKNTESGNFNQELTTLLRLKIEEYKSKSKPKPNRDWSKANELIAELEEILKSATE